MSSGQDGLKARRAFGRKFNSAKLNLAKTEFLTPAKLNLSRLNWASLWQPPARRTHYYPDVSGIMGKKKLPASNRES